MRDLVGRYAMVWEGQKQKRLDNRGVFDVRDKPVYSVLRSFYFGAATGETEANHACGEQRQARRLRYAGRIAVAFSLECGAEEEKVTFGAAKAEVQLSVVVQRRQPANGGRFVVIQEANQRYVAGAQNV